MAVRTAGAFEAAKDYVAPLIETFLDRENATYSSPQQPER